MASITPDCHQAATASISTVQKLELASLNQFLIRFQQHYSTCVASLQYLKCTKIGSTPFTIDAALCCNATHPIFEEKAHIWLFVFSCREYENWVKNSLTRLKMLHIWLQRHSDEYFAPFVFFCPDSLLISSLPLNSIYSCELEEDGHLTAIRHSITF